jgi:hypothetical protein
MAAQGWARSYSDLFLVREFLANRNIYRFRNPPYSPDLVPTDFTFSQRWRCSWKVAVFTPLPGFSANRRLPHTCDHKNSNIKTPDVNKATSLGTLPYQDWRSLQLRVQLCAAICWRATELIRKLFDTSMYVVQPAPHSYWIVKGFCSLSPSFE